MLFLANLLTLAIDIYIWIIIIDVLIHWLLAFGVINTQNPQAQNLVNLLKKLTSPVMDRVRKYVPPIGGIDLTPIIVIFAGQFLKWIIVQIFVF